MTIIGEVKTIGGGTLHIMAEGQVITEDRIWINPTLLDGHCPRLVGTLTGTGYRGAAVSVDVPPQALSAQGHGIGVGDRVILLTTDRQTYYLLAQVVRYG